MDSENENEIIIHRDISLVHLILILKAEFGLRLLAYLGYSTFK